VWVVASSDRFDRAAHILSIFGSPPLLALPIAFLAGLRGGGYPSSTPSVIELLLSACAIPSLFALILFRTGATRTLDLAEREDRFLPSVVTAGSCAAAWVLLSTSGADASLSSLAIGISAQMALLAVLTTRWKVSYHSASAAALVVVSRTLGVHQLTLVCLLVAVSVGWARIHKRRHSLAEVTAGALTSIPIVAVTGP
jgi:hypothetical protein